MLDYLEKVLRVCHPVNVDIEIDGNCCNILLRAMSVNTESAFHDFPSIPAWCSCSIILSRSPVFTMSTFKSCLRSPDKFYNSDQQDQLLHCILTGVTCSQKGWYGIYEQIAQNGSLQWR